MIWWQTLFLSMFKSHLFKTDILLAACLFIATMAALFIWVPLDIDTGLVERVRRRNVIGDALGPVTALILIAIAALALVREGRTAPRFVNKGKWHLVFGFYVALFGITLFVMRYLGPWMISAVDMFIAADLNYRNLRNIWPLKYLGYVTGGTIMLCALSHFMDQSLTRKRALLFLAITFAIALFFDLPFEDILLPPNGDV